MDYFSFIGCLFFLLFINNSCLIFTLKCATRLDLKMKKDRNRLKDTIYMPKNKNQEKYIDYLNNDCVNLIIAIGPAVLFPIPSRAIYTFISLSLNPNSFNTEVSILLYFHSNFIILSI